MFHKIFFMLIVFPVFLVISCTNEAGNVHEPALIWKDTDFDETREAVKEVGIPLRTVEHTLHQRPPFYPSKLPLTWASIEVPRLVTLVQDFGNWRNQFVYLDLRSKGSARTSGARTLDNESGKVLAEARLIEFIRGKTIKIEEIHYDSSGKIKFSCESHIDFDGFKTNETNTKGQKGEDYYFVWPVGK